MKKLIVLIICAVAFTACKNNDEAVLLRLNLQKGDAFTVVSKVKTEAAMMFLETETELKVVVDEIKDNNTLFVCTADVLGMKYKSKMGEEEENYNSAVDEANMTSAEKEMHRDLKDVLESEMVFTVNNRSQIVEKLKYKTGEGGMLDEPIDMKDLFLNFPENTVKENDTWNDEKTNSLTGGKSAITYTVKKISDKEVIIEATTKIAAIGGVLPENTLKGEYIIEKATGKLIKYEAEMKLQSAIGGGKAMYTIERK